MAIHVFTFKNNVQFFFFTLLFSFSVLMTSSCSFEFFLQSLKFARHVKKLEISDVDLSHLDTRRLQEHFQASVMLRPESYGKLIFFFFGG